MIHTPNNSLQRTRLERRGCNRRILCAGALSLGRSHMKAFIIILTMAVAVVLARAADKPVDLTGADASEFKSQLGHTVSLPGRLEQGMQGPCLFGATPTNVVFYVIPEVPRGGYTYPKTWTGLMHQQVRLTGELKFRSFDRSKVGPLDQIPPDYYYMVLQRTKIEGLESK